MKLLQLTILIFCVLFSTAHAINNSSENASISATATVLPMLGVMHHFNHSQLISVTEATDSKLFIQAPKNSALIVHLSNDKSSLIKSSLLLKSSTKKNSVADMYSLDLLESESQQIITIITIDN